MIARGAVHLNAQGASRRRVAEAMGLLAEAGSAEAFLRGLARNPRRLAADRQKKEPALAAADTLALEMALHEEEELRVLQGELSALEAAWRDAEEIAGIADRLAVAPGGGA